MKSGTASTRRFHSGVIVAQQLAASSLRYFSEVLIELNLVLRFEPRPLTATMIAIEIPAAIRPYSWQLRPIHLTRTSTKHANPPPIEDNFDAIQCIIDTHGVLRSPKRDQRNLMKFPLIARSNPDRCPHENSYMPHGLSSGPFREHRAPQWPSTPSAYR
jgi:hypothetical protein